MPESPFIPRHKVGANELGFERLRREAIGLIEEVSGQVWSDYNLHDPGITILEQLIYAITDLSYRCEFPVQDFLANETGEIDHQQQALHLPHEILTCRPTTPADYRKLWLNALPVIDNLWLDELESQEDQLANSNGEAESSDPVRGLYQLAVKLAQDVDPERHNAIKGEIRRIYRGARNLCEDLEDVVVVDNLDYELSAEIEVGGAYSPAEILAQIYIDCARRVASSPAITTYDQIDTDNDSLDQLFDGPYTEHGFFLGDDNSRQSGFPVSSLFAVVNQIRGVEQVKGLYLSRSGKDYYDQIPAPKRDQALDLAVPQSQDRIRVKLTAKGRELPISIDDLRARYDEIHFKEFASRQTEQNLSMLYRPIEADTRPMQLYFSIQNQFPAIYGVNRFGVPASAAPEVKGRVRQLKAYLLIFEQYLVNFLANLDSLDRLFSAETESKTSYATQVLDPQQVSDLDAVYPNEPAQAFRDISAKFDNFNQRKGRLLDYLLALYGERFNQRSLRHFNYYYGKDEVDDVILANKVAFLRNIVGLGRDRGAAADFLADNGQPVSGLAQRAALLLDFAQPPLWPTEACATAGLELCAHSELRDRLGDSDALRTVAADQIETGQYAPPAQAARTADQPLEQMRDRLENIVLLNQGLLSEALLTQGIDIQNYRVGRDSPAEKFRLYLELDEAQFWQLGQFDDEDAAARAANDLRCYLLQLNRRSESIHLIEHLMLRPRQASAGTPHGEFYSFRLSAVLPAWSRRCRNRHFRNLVCETLRLNAPAHVLVEFHWLEFEQMRAFEDLYQSWLDAMRAGDDATHDRHARPLVDFILAAETSGDEKG